MATDAEVFRAWADTGSYQAAGRRYGVTPAHVKRVVAASAKAFALHAEGEIAFADPTIARSLGTIPFNPNELIRRQGYQTIRDMRRDDQVKAAMQFKKNTVVAPGWQVVSPEGEDEDWEVRRFVEDQLLGLEAALSDCLKEIMSAFDFGYSVTEKVFHRIEDGEFNGKVGLHALKSKHPQWIDFDVDEFGNIREDGVIQRQPTGMVRMPRGKFVVYVHQMEFSNPYGLPDLDATYKAWWAKANAYKWIVMLLEKFGIPPTFVLYDPQSYSPAQQTELLNAVQDIQATTAGIIPRRTKDSLEFWAPELANQASRVFVPAINMFDRHIARSILMPGLLGLTPDDATGSLARARVHFDVFLQVVTQEENRLEESVMDEQVIRQLVDLNFTVEAYPLFRFLPLTEDIKKETMDAWAVLIGAGAVVSTGEDEAHIRDVLKFPSRDVSTDGEPKPLPEPEPDDDEPPGGEPPPEDDVPEGPPGGVAKPSLSSRGTPPARRTFALSRAKNRFERRVDFRRIDRDLNALEADAVSELVPLLEDVRDRFLKFFETKFDGKASSVRQITELRGMPAVTTSLGDFLELTLDAGSQSVQREFVRRMQADEPNFKPAAASRFLAAKKFQITGVVESQILAGAHNTLLRAIETGELQRDTAGKLRDLFEPYVGDPNVIRDGKVISPHRLETIIRTNATDAFNRGRVLEARASGDLLQGFQYSAIIDERTTDVCAGLDGRVFKPGDPNLDALKPPRHFNCRSLLIPVVVGTTIEESDLLTPRQAGRATELSGKGFK